MFIFAACHFDHLKKLFHQAPLSESQLAELKDLAKVFEPKMAEWMEKNPEMC